MNENSDKELYAHLARMEKVQGVRLFDVFLLGPAMIYAGNKRTLTPNLSTLFMLAGIGTIIFNGANYVKIEQLKKSLGQNNG